MVVKLELNQSLILSIQTALYQTEQEVQKCIQSPKFRWPFHTAPEEHALQFFPESQRKWGKHWEMEEMKTANESNDTHSFVSPLIAFPKQPAKKATVGVTSSLPLCPTANN